MMQKQLNLPLLIDLKDFYRSYEPNLSMGGMNIV